MCISGLYILHFHLHVSFSSYPYTSVAPYISVLPYTICFTLHPLLYQTCLSTFQLTSSIIPYTIYISALLYPPRPPPPSLFSTLHHLYSLQAYTLFYCTPLLHFELPIHCLTIHPHYSLHSLAPLYLVSSTVSCS